MRGPRPPDIQRALRLLEKAEDHYRKGSPASGRWLAIGCMAEASESCLAAHPEAAEEIRLERLVMMDDPFYYVPDFKSLAARVRALQG